MSIRTNITPKTMILGLDISTSTIGIAVLYDNGHLAEMTHISLNTKANSDIPLDYRDIHKAKLFGEKMAELKEKYEALSEEYGGKEELKINEVIIEKALEDANRTTRHTVNLLQRFNGMCTTYVVLIFGFYPHRITENDLRKKFMPEFVRKETVMEQNPDFLKAIDAPPYKQVANGGKTLNKKHMLIKEKFPDFNIPPYVYIEKEIYNNPHKGEVKEYILDKIYKHYEHLGEKIKPVMKKRGEGLAKCNYDMCDAYVCAKAGMEILGLQKKLV